MWLLDEMRWDLDETRWEVLFTHPVKTAQSKRLFLAFGNRYRLMKSYHMAGLTILTKLKKKNWQWWGAWNRHSAPCHAAAVFKCAELPLKIIEKKKCFGGHGITLKSLRTHADSRRTRFDVCVSSFDIVSVCLRWSIYWFDR